MPRFHRWLPALWLLAGCQEREPPTGVPAVIAIAPLQLEDADNVCWDLAVANQDGDPVWRRGTPGQAPSAKWPADDQAVCSRPFGSGPGGDIAYVGTCDASPVDDDGDGVDDPNTNVVTVWLDGVYRADGSDLGDWRDPCPNGCTVAVDCVENADVRVDLDLTIMRRAQQGFFDIGVDFEDVFCSAKLDCLPALLHHGDVRDTTAVVGFACTAGPGGDPTTLYLSDLVVDCAGAPTATPPIAPHRYTLSPSAAEQGNHGGLPPGIFQHATYFGVEGFTAFDKCYWNTAIGLDLDALEPSCTLTARGTAGGTPFDTAPLFHTPEHTVYPVIDWRVPLTDASGALTCGAHPLDAGTGVSTEYTTFEGESFANAYRCGGTPATSTSCDITLATTATTFAAQANVGASAIAWDMGDGTTLDTPSVTHTFASPGPHAVTVHVADGTQASYFAAVNQGLGALSISGGCRLDTLNLRDNALTSLDLRALSELTTVYLDRNQLATLQTSGLAKLTAIYASSNQIGALDIAAAVDLAVLDVGNNRLTHLGLADHPALTDVNARNNELTSIDVSRGVDALTTLNLRDNHLASLDLTHCHGLEIAYLERNQLATLDTAGLTALTHVYAATNAIATIDLAAATDLALLDIGGNLLTTLDLSDHPVLTDLSAPSNHLTSVDLTGDPALTTLNLRDNQVATLDVTSCTSLATAYLERNHMTTLSVGGLAALRYLYASTNDLASIDLTAALGLVLLDLAANDFTSFDLADHPALTDLDLRGNALTALDTSGDLGALSVANLRENQLASLDLSGWTSLTIAYLDDNQLASLDVSGLASLTHVYASRNRLTSLAASGNAALRALELGASIPSTAAMDAVVAALYDERAAIPAGLWVNLTNVGVAFSATTLDRLATLAAAPYGWDILR